jgi:hypothetical protein
MAKGDAAKLRAYRALITKLIHGWHAEEALAAHNARNGRSEDPDVVRHVFQRWLFKRLYEFGQVEPESWEPIRKSIAVEYAAREEEARAAHKPVKRRRAPAKAAAGARA